MSIRQVVAVAAIAVALASSPTLATTSGICFRMANVPAGDTLNLRARPSARAPILARYANSSEVIIAKTGPCGRWCKVSTHDGSGSKRGWVNSRYLVRRECP